MSDHVEDCWAAAHWEKVSPFRCAAARKEFQNELQWLRKSRICYLERELAPLARNTIGSVRRAEQKRVVHRLDPGDAKILTEATP